LDRKTSTKNKWWEGERPQQDVSTTCSPVRIWLERLVEVARPPQHHIATAQVQEPQRISVHSPAQIKLAHIRKTTICHAPVALHILVADDYTES